MFTSRDQISCFLSLGGGSTRVPTSSLTASGKCFDLLDDLSISRKYILGLTVMEDLRIARISWIFTVLQGRLLSSVPFI